VSQEPPLPAAPLFPRDPWELEAVATRIAQSIASAEAMPSEAQRRVLVFLAGTARLGLPLTAIREVVVPPAALSKVPRAPAALLGIMNLRGRVVAVVDLLYVLPAHLLGPPASPAVTLPTNATGARILMLERGRREVGLLVQGVEGITDDRPGPALPVVLDPEQVGAAIEALVA
jgi:purine-binding chemotaxis protein CheW